MISRIQKALTDSKIASYRINCNKSESVELFFIKKEKDMLRSTDVTEYSVTVYRDFEVGGVKMRGNAVTLIFPAMEDSEILKAVNHAY